MHSQVVVLGGGPGGYAAAFLGGRSGAGNHDRRSRPAPRRHLPAARLHSVEGPAARRPGDRAKPARWPSGASSSRKPKINVDARPRPQREGHQPRSPAASSNSPSGARCA